MPVEKIKQKIILSPLEIDTKLATQLKQKAKELDMTLSQFRRLIYKIILRDYNQIFGVLSEYHKRIDRCTD